MDREKAADLLDNLIGMVEDNHGADYDTALKMGIEALSTNGDGPEPVDDTISRQAAIDAMSVVNDSICGQQAIDALCALPSAQLYTDEEIRKIQELEQAQLDKAYELGKQAAEPQWIPCSERLPEYDGEMYLVTDYCEQINRRRIHVSYCYVNREGFWSDVPLGYKVLAWMPLPEPYKERREE